jgi:hypothetical protein
MKLPIGEFDLGQPRKQLFYSEHPEYLMTLPTHILGSWYPGTCKSRKG